MQNMDKEKHMNQHSLTDSMWLHKNSFDNKEIIKLINEVKEKTHITLNHEATYDWIVFPYSKTKIDQPVATRYFGRMKNGKMKIRGLMSRKKDSPEIVNMFQNDIYNMLSKMNSVNILKRNEVAFLNVRDYYIRIISQNAVSLDKLIINKTISKNASDYANKSPAAIISQSLLKQGIVIHPGESIKYIVTNLKAHDLEKRYIPFSHSGKIYDQSYYTRLIQNAYSEIFNLFFKDSELIATIELFE